MNVPDLLANAVTRFADRLCIVQGERSIDFAATDERSDRLAQGFAAHGLRPGDRVALLASNELEYLEIQIAAQRAGVILVPLNFRLATPELTAIVEDCSPRLLIQGPGYAQQATDLSLDETWHLGTEGVGESYEVVLTEFDPSGNRGYLDSSAPASILYTSGTTGRPKGAVITNGNLWARVNSWAQEVQTRPGDVFVCTLPMFHVAAHAVYAFVYRGATIVLMRGFDVPDTVRALEKHRATHTVFVPSMVPRVLEHVTENGPDLESLRCVLYGGSAIAPEVLRSAISILGCDFWQGYGLTEAVAVSTLRAEDHDPVGHPERLASAGLDSLSHEVRVVTPDGADCAMGEVGEIIIRGPGVINEYWNAPEATATVIRDGWLHSGDLGYRSADGYLYLTDRLKDMIVTGGENVYSREVEDALHEHEGILEVAVIGIPSAEWGEAVHAVVVPRDGVELDPDELIAHCRERLAGYKAPKTVEIVDEPLPKNAAEKIMKRQIRDAYWQGVERSIG